EGDLQGVIEDGDISEDTTLCGDITLNDDLITRDALTLTIRPGTVISVGVDKRIDLGYSGDETTLMIEGTADDPIVFQGTTTDPGHWNTLRVRGSVTSNSIMEYVEIRHAGADGSAGLTVESDKSIEFSNITVEDVAGAGVQAVSFGSDSENLTVNNAGGPAVIATSLKAATDFPVGGSFSGNNPDAIQISDGDYGDDATLVNAGIPYIAADDIITRGAMTLTIEPGVEVQVGVDKRIDLGYSGDQVTVNAAGTSDQPIRFVGTAQESGHWGTIRVRDSVTSDSVFDWIEVSHTGANDEAGMLFDAAVTLKNATFSDNEIAGFRVYRNGLQAESENVTVNNADGASAILDFDALFTIPTGGSYGSGDAYVEVADGDVDKSGTVPAIDGIPYRITDSVITRGSVDLNFAAGVIFDIEIDERFDFGYSGDETTFTIDDVTFRGTTQSPGHWRQILVRSSVTSDSSLTNSQILHAGSSSKAAVEITSGAAGFTLTGNTIEQAANACIDRPDDDTTDYASNNTLDCSGGDYAQ
ncbi:MAG: hypothetical protein ACQEVA_21755, partial [Myxococcota bacterium]